MSSDLFTREARSLCAATMIWTLAIAPAMAGGIDFSPDTNTDAGPSYFGVATDQGGSPVPDTKVTVTVAKLNSTVVQRADSQGHFFIQGFDKSVNPKDVSIVCSKNGYQDAQATKTVSSDATAPVQVLCTMQKKA